MESPSLFSSATSSQQFEAAADWVRRFAARWSTPDPQALRDLMHEDTRNLIPPMERPGSREEVVAHFQSMLQRVPDLRLEVARWAVAGDAVFVEWDAHATVRGAPLHWRGVDRVILREGKTVESQAFWDTQRQAQDIARALKEHA
ncbi:nuclear transport factor 2 family protein [Ramlibacter sp.]|uniref:nuclear transport factor 2 family protein n=1 Tax=Ramlibacter sp. TaxID=1917967 RepID=UPI001830902D|nr:nuclear transport factor 2 family protein [Ramlibacter sp.]MBA2672909.1 nuclear transport factor 2 family protein [Ramlibacter sp.]